jgi:hypothetical protein
VLVREKAMIDMPGPDGRKSKRAEWLVYLKPAASWSKYVIELRQSRTMALSAPAAPAASMKTAAGEFEVGTGEVVGPPIDSKAARYLAGVKDLLAICDALGCEVDMDRSVLARLDAEDLIIAGRTVRASLNAFLTSLYDEAKTTVDFAAEESAAIEQAISGKAVSADELYRIGVLLLGEAEDSEENEEEDLAPEEDVL